MYCIRHQSMEKNVFLFAKLFPRLYFTALNIIYILKGILFRIVENVYSETISHSWASLLLKVTSVKR